MVNGLEDRTLGGGAGAPAHPVTRLKKPVESGRQRLKLSEPPGDVVPFRLDGGADGITIPPPILGHPAAKPEQFVHLGQAEPQHLGVPDEMELLDRLGGEFPVA
jgi:hypothetical protein